MFTGTALQDSESYPKIFPNIEKQASIFLLCQSQDVNNYQAVDEWVDFQIQQLY